MGGGNMGGRGRIWRSGPVSEAPPMGIRTQKPVSKNPAFGGALGERLLGPYANKRACKTSVCKGPNREARAGNLIFEVLSAEIQ